MDANAVDDFLGDGWVHAVYAALHPHANQWHRILPLIESPLEHDFWHQVLTHAAGGWKSFQAQRSIGPYRVDSLFVSGAGNRVAVELDGTRYHDAVKDAARDRWLLDDSGEVDEIIRVPYAAMHHFPTGTMRILGTWHDEFRTPDECFVVTAAEWKREYAETVAMIELGHADWLSADSFLDWAEPTYDVWDANDSIGLVQSPKAYMYCWNTKPIIRRRRHHSPPHAGRGAGDITAGTNEEG